MFRAAWKLANTVPVTKEWAYTLWRTLSKVYPEYDIDLMKTIERWKGDDGKFIALRVLLASSLHGDDFDKLRNSEDVEMRQAYYGKFFCRDEKLLDGYFDKDKEKFIESAISNKNLYCTEKVRDKLSELASKVNGSDLLYFNIFKSTQERHERLHPDWFKEDVEPDDDVAEEVVSEDAFSAQNFKKLWRL